MRKRAADPPDDHLFAGMIGVGDEIVPMLLRDRARTIEPVAQERAGLARERGDERERVQGAPPRKRRG